MCGVVPKMGNFLSAVHITVLGRWGTVVGGGGGSSDRSGMKQVWKCIYDLKLPNKIQSFAWRAYREALATKSNLKNRQITKDDIYTQCGKEPKISLHLFWFCDRVKEVWSNSKTVFPFFTDSKWSFVDVVWQLVQHRSI